MKLFEVSTYYPGFEFPKGLKKITELGITDLDIWFILDAAFAHQYYLDMKNRYPERDLIPFAKRTDNDDVACFEIDKPNKVEIIHDFAEPGWEQRDEYNNFWSWFKAAVDEFVSRSIEDENDEL